MINKNVMIKNNLVVYFQGSSSLFDTCKYHKPSCLAVFKFFQFPYVINKIKKKLLCYTYLRNEYMSEMMTRKPNDHMSKF